MSLNYSGTLVVPLSLDARVIEGGFTVNDATAVFSRLPWQSTSEVHHSDVPFLGSSVMSPPFQDKNFTMAAGVHLHWILPEAHRTYTTSQDSSAANVPAAPNRWLVTRKSDGTQWVVESDYINTQQKKSLFNANAITVPVQGMGQQGKQPYVYLGRQLPLATWLGLPALSTTESFGGMGKGPLTAFGYGELSFNTYYPNCHSVFGFFDDKPKKDNDTYEVLGWYADANHDILNETNQNLNSILSGSDDNAHLLSLLFEPQNDKCPKWLTPFIAAGLQHIQHKDLWQSAWLKLSDQWTELAGNQTALSDFYQYGIEQALKWKVPEASGLVCPQNSVYYGQITLGADESIPVFNQISVAHTGLEALSTYMAGLLKSSTVDADSIEEDLNAMLAGAAVQRDLVDVDLNISEALHNRNFMPEAGELIWLIKKRKTGQHSETADAMASDLPGSAANQLNALNLAQVALEKTQQEVAAAKYQVYADWCKYMHCSYPPLGESENLPDPDEIKNYVEWEMSTLEITEAQDKIAEKQAAVDAAKKALNTTLSGYKTNTYEYELLEVPGPRYYKPKDPVVLFASDGTETLHAAPSKNPKNALFSADIAPLSGSNKSQTQLTAVTTSLGTLVKGQSNFSTTSGNWSPQLLQWQVGFHPDAQPGLSNDENIEKNLLQGNYEVPYNGFGLAPKTSLTKTGGVEYSGSTYASVGTKAHMQEIIEGLLLRLYPSALTKDDFQPGEDDAPKPVLAMHWYKVAGLTADDLSNPACVAFEAYKKLEDIFVITQSLGGLNKALLQHKHNVQLPITDPLAFGPYQLFNQIVNECIGDTYVAAPLPDNYFLPVRAGQLKLQILDLVDHFGVSNPAETQSPFIAASMKATGAQSDMAYLPPTFVQDARLNFRWLSANTPASGTDIEMNHHPATSPICGWLMPNYLDNSLMIYDQSGQGLGSMIFNSDGSYDTWKPFPASASAIADFPTTAAAINPHLLSVLKSVKADNSGFMSNVETAQGMINPEYFAGGDSMAVLVGKPVAVVRANIGFSLKEGVVHDQGWVPFGNQLAVQAPATKAYEKVNISIRLGEQAQLNDGLIAFGNEATGGVPALNWVDNAGGNNTITSTLTSPTQTLIMLMDPHGIVHATSGVLPVKTINIPPEQYVSALKKMQMLFSSQPILTPANKLQLSLPKESGYQWSWLQKVGDKYLEIPDMQLTSNTIFSHAWKLHLSSTAQTSPTAAELWPLLEPAGWLKALDFNSQMFQIIALTDSLKSALTGTGTLTIDSAMQDAIAEVLNASATGMVAFNQNTTFYPKQELVEGWLRLSEIES